MIEANITQIFKEKKLRKIVWSLSFVCQFLHVMESKALYDLYQTSLADHQHFHSCSQVSWILKTDWLKMNGELVVLSLQYSGHWILS